jgi:hypothetical protein
MFPHCSHQLGNLATGILKIKLAIHSMGDYVAALGQPDDLHGHMFAFVGDQVGEQLPSTFLKPKLGGTLVAFLTVNIDAPSQAVIVAHCAQANAPIILPSVSPTVCLQHPLCVCKKVEIAKPTCPRLQCDHSAAWLGLARNCKANSQLGHAPVEVRC